MSLNIIFAGTPELASTILQTLIKGPHTIQAVFTQPDRPAGRGQVAHMSPVKQLAIRHELPVFQPISFKQPADQAILHTLKPDLMVVAAYGLLLPPAVLSIPRLGCLNVHVSLLPRWRGAAPIQHAILAGDSLSGVTIMQMDAGLDTGDILSLHPCTIELNETSETLHHRLAEIGANALMKTLHDLEKGKIIPQKQDPTHATYASKISKQDAKITWSDPAEHIDRQIRAFYPWPIAHTLIDNQPLRIFSAKPLSTSTHSLPGTIIQSNAEGIDVACGTGVLRLLEIQLPGGKRMSVSSLLNSKAALFKTGTQFAL